MTLIDHPRLDEALVGDVVFPQTTPQADVDVLVVGGGPTGLATALELSLFGLSVAVIERATHAPLVRAGAMGHTQRVAELFRRWDVLHDIRQSWTVPPEWNTGIHHVTSLLGHRLGVVNSRTFAAADRQPNTIGESIRRPQTVVQNALLRKLESRGVSVSGGWEWSGATEHDDRVHSELRNVESGQVTTVTSQFLVGADGSHSPVRVGAGIDRDGPYAPHRNLRYVVRVVGGYPAGVGLAPSATNIVANQHYSGFLAAINETDWRVYYGPLEGDELPSEAELVAHAQRAFGAPIELQVVAVHPFWPSKRVARSFRRGRTVLVGDAAHVRTPGGNLGEGLGDVVNLGWKLAAVVRGNATVALLDTYDEERRVHNHRVGDHAADRAARGAANLDAARELGFPDDQDLSDAAEQRRLEITNRLRQGVAPSPGVTFDERYDESSGIWYDNDQRDHETPWHPERYEDLALPGHRAPDGDIDPYGTRLYDRITTNPVLLVGDRDATGFVDALVDAGQRRGVTLDVVYLFDDAVRQIYRAPITLIRPDHHVAWHGGSGDPQAIIDRLLALDTAPERADATPAAS